MAENTNKTSQQEKRETLLKEIVTEDTTKQTDESLNEKEDDGNPEKPETVTTIKSLNVKLETLGVKKTEDANQQVKKPVPIDVKTEENKQPIKNDTAPRKTTKGAPMKREISPLKRQIWVVAAPVTYLYCVGMVLSFPSILLPALRKDPKMKPSLVMESWIASAVGIAGMFGYLIIGISLEYIGRKRSQVFIFISGVTGWTFIYIADSLNYILIGRIFCGISVGCSIGLSAAIISEYSCPEYRGMFLNLKSTASSLGSVSVHMLQYVTTWDIVAIIPLVMYIIPLTVNLISFPESPIWLADSKQYEQCEEAFFWIRGRTDESIEEYEQMLKLYEMKHSLSDANKTCGSKFVGFLKSFKRRDFYMPILTILMGIIVMESSGRHTFVSYAPDILTKIIGPESGTSNLSLYILIVSDSILTATAFITPILIKKIKRRFFLLSTGIAALCVLLMFCIYMALQAYGVISRKYYYAPIAMFVVYFFLAMIGCSPVPYVLLGELLPVQSKGVGTVLAGIILSICLQMSLQSMPFLLYHTDVYGTFAITGTVLGLGLLILYFILPETKDKSLMEIEHWYITGRYH